MRENEGEMDSSRRTVVRGDAQACAVERAVATALALAPWRDGVAQGRLWVAASGGLDSTVLLHAARRLPNVHAIHMDHRLHPSSADWARHCAATAAQFGTGFQQRRLTVARTGNLEANARRARYQAWRELLDAGDLLLLAHHADDQAETRLWQLLTGRSPGGMPAERELGRGRLVRPLLAVRRRDIRTYADRFGLRWIEDPTNDDLRFDRNFIRKRLMPLVESRFPAAIERLTAARPPPEPALPPLPAAGATGQRIEAWLLAAGLPAARRAIAEIRRQSEAAQDRLPNVAVAASVKAWRHQGCWHLVRTLPPSAERRAEHRIVVGCKQDLCNGTLAWQRTASGLPQGQELHIRHRRGGERIRLADRSVTKTIKALHCERHIPPWRRPGWPLLYDAADGLVAVAGLGIAAEVAVADGLAPVWMPRTDTLTTEPQPNPSAGASRLPPNAHDA